jgi:hypothetical protein
MSFCLVDGAGSAFRMMSSWQLPPAKRWSAPEEISYPTQGDGFIGRRCARKFQFCLAKKKTDKRHRSPVYTARYRGQRAERARKTILRSKDMNLRSYANEQSNICGKHVNCKAPFKLSNACSSGTSSAGCTCITGSGSSRPFSANGALARYPTGLAQRAFRWVLMTSHDCTRRAQRHTVTRPAYPGSLGLPGQLLRGRPTDPICVFVPTHGDVDKAHKRGATTLGRLRYLFLPHTMSIQEKRQGAGDALAAPSAYPTHDFGFVPISRRLRYNPQQPIEFGLTLNIIFGVTSTFGAFLSCTSSLRLKWLTVMANLYYSQPLLSGYSA